VIIRRLLVVVAGLLLAVQVVRNSAVAAFSELRPQTAARFWASHPAVELSLGLFQIGRAARERKRVSPASFAMIDDERSPAAAKRDFAAAQWRDPRSLPAAYFLADYYFRAGQPIEGLRQTAILARLSPGGIASVAPFVAAYAQSRANWPQIRGLFESQPAIEDGVLVALAGSAANSDAVLALADSRHRSTESPWLGVLLQSLTAAGQYSKAHAIWASVAGVRTEAGAFLFDAGFDSPKPPPPFNWGLTSSTVGLAERQPGHRLHVIFYGSDDGVLASQLLLLPPGAYRLRFQLAGGATHPEALSWSIRCDKARTQLSSVAVDTASAHGWTFQIPAGCAAQWLELSGRSGDITQQSDATITNLSLGRANAGA
jgi:hypothetical protein